MNEKRPQVLTATLGNTHHHFRSPLECWRGTSPNQAARCRPFLKSDPSPIAAIIAVAVFGPIPRIWAILWRTSLALKIASIFRSKVLMRLSIWSMKAYKLETISRIRTVSSSLGVASIFGISRRARVAETAIAIPRSSKSPRIWLISAVR